MSCGSASGGAVCPGSPTLAQLQAGLAIPTLPSGGSVTFTVLANVTAASGSVSNTASVAVPAGVTDANGANNQGTDTDSVIVVASNADLAITKTNGSSTVNAGASTTYTIVVSNAGPQRRRRRRRHRCGRRGAHANERVLRQRKRRRSVPGQPDARATSSRARDPDAAFRRQRDLHRSRQCDRCERQRFQHRERGDTCRCHRSERRQQSATDTDSVTVVTSSADLTVTKTNGASTLTSGAVTTYTIVVSNAGPKPPVGRL